MVSPGEQSVILVLLRHWVVQGGVEGALENSVRNQRTELIRTWARRPLLLFFEPLVSRNYQTEFGLVGWFASRVCSRSSNKSKHKSKTKFCFTKFSLVCSYYAIQNCSKLLRLFGNFPTRDFRLGLFPF